MIKIIFYCDKEDFLKAFKVSGHASYAPLGKDIVCAGVSSLSQGIIIGLEDVAGAQLEIDKKAGKLTCKVLGKYQDKSIQVLLRTLFISLQELAKNYPDYINFSEERSVPAHEN